MKLPFIPLHIVTTKTLKLRRDAAYQIGREFSEKQIALLVGERAMKGLKVKQRRS